MTSATPSRNSPAWPRPWKFSTSRKYISVPIAGLIVWFLVVRGSYSQVEKIFLVACVFYLSYVVSAFLAKPDWLLAAKETVVPTFQPADRIIC